MAVEISIIIPVFNAEKTIECCVESTVCQNNELIEVILIDDGSTDATSEKCSALREKYGFVKYFRVENGGVSRARNIGIERASGKWIMFIDSDDCLEEAAIDLCLNHLNQGTELIHFGMIRDYFAQGECTGSVKKEMPLFSQTGQKKNELNVIKDFERLFDNEVFDSACGKVFNASLIKKHGICFDEEVRYREDTVFVLNYCKYIDCVTLLNYAGYHYRIENNDMYHYRRNVYIREIEQLYHAFDDILRKVCLDKESAENKIVYFIFQVLLCGIIHNSAKQYNGSIVNVRRYMIDGISNAAVYSCIEKNRAKGKFLQLINFLLKYKCVTLASVLCYLRFWGL